MSFAFPPRTVAFLRDLRDNNTRDWFQAHRDEYLAAYVEPAREFVMEVGPALAEFGVRAEPRINGSIFRINRDLRFSRDKRPYKDHLDIGFWPGARKESVSGFLFRVTPDLVAVGAGAHDLPRTVLDSTELGEMAEQLEAAGIGVRRERAGLHAVVTEPPTLASDPDLVPRCLEVWRAVAPLHRWIVAQSG